MEQTDTKMKQAMSYLFAGLFGIFLSIMYLVNNVIV